MKRQNSSNYKSILHFFKAVPRNSQENTPATTNTGSDNVSQTTCSSGPMPSDRGQTSPAVVPSVSFSSNPPTTIDASTTDTIMTSIEVQPFPTSQTSANSGASRRVISNGHQAVLDSESDEFEELDFGLSAPKVKVPTYTGRPSRRIGFDEPELRRPPKESKKSGKRSFSKLMETAQKSLDIEREILKHKADLEKDDDLAAPVATTLDKDTLKQAINDDEDSDEADRLYKAMQRTNEVQVQTAYHFFEDIPKLTLLQHFPQQSLPDHGWTACFEDASSREQAFMSGFAHQIFRLQELPEELASWMIDQICVGHDAALDPKYLEILKAHDEVLGTQLSRERLDAIFRAIGAQVQSLGANDKISPTEAYANSQCPLPPSLKRVAALLTTAAPWLHTKARIHAFHLLCHICLDDRVSLDPDVLNAVQDAMEAIICQYSNNHKLTSGVGSPHPDDALSLITSQLTYVLPRLLSRITHPLLQANLVHAFPMRSPLTAYLQRHLALSFLLHPTTVDIPLADAQLPGLIHTYLESSPHYRMRKDTNYSHLAARLTLLDIAIGPGPLTVPYLPLTSPAPSETGSSPVMAPVPTSSEVKDFNKEVDALAQHIKLLSNSIVETGAALDLTILEAKERCERVYWRLQHAARIGGKKADNVFGDNEEEKQPKIKNFLKVLPKKSAPKSIFDEQGNDELST